MFDKIIAFIWLSSADPSEISLTIKGLAGYIVPLLMMLFGWDNSTAGAFFSETVAAVATLFTLVGLARKLWLTYKGQNKAVQG